MYACSSSGSFAKDDDRNVILQVDRLRAGKGFAVRGTGIDKHGGVNITWRSEYIYMHIIYIIYLCTGGSINPQLPFCAVLKSRSKQFSATLVWFYPRFV